MSNTGIQVDDLRHLIGTVLGGLSKGAKRGGMASDDAVELVLRTIVCEGLIGNNFHLRQKLSGGRIGVARGIAQMEPFTARSIINDYLDFRPSLRGDIEKVCLCDLSMIDDETPEEMALMDLQLQGNLLLNIALVRMKYRPIPRSIPPANEVEAQANYWLRFYNAGGKGTVTKFLRATGRIEK